MDHKVVGDKVVRDLSLVLINKSSETSGLTVDEISEIDIKPLGGDKPGTLSRASAYRAIKTYPQAFPQSLDSGWPRKFYCIPENLPKFDETANAFKSKAPSRPVGSVEAYFSNQPYAKAIKELTDIPVKQTLDKAREALAALDGCYRMTTAHLEGSGAVDEDHIETSFAKIPAMIDTLKGIAAGLSRIEAHPLYGMPTQYLALVTEGTEAP